MEAFPEVKLQGVKLLGCLVFLDASSPEALSHTSHTSVPLIPLLQWRPPLQLQT